LDQDIVVEVLSRQGVNVSDAARELGVASADLRRLLCAKPHLTDMAVELEERRLDLAEKNIYEALRSDESRRRDAASFFVLRNTARAKRRGWIVSASVGVDMTINASLPPRQIVYRWRTDDDDKRDAEAERLCEGKTAIGIGWDDGGKAIEHETGPDSSNKD
jgi:hypothetical protein